MALPEAVLAISLIIALPHWPVLFRGVGERATSSVKCTQWWLRNRELLIISFTHQEMTGRWLVLVTLVIHRWVQNKIRAPYNLIKYKTILLDDNLWFCALAWRRLPLAAFLDIIRIFQCRVMILWQGKLNHTLGGGLYTAQVGMALFLRVGVSFEIH